MEILLFVSAALLLSGSVGAEDNRRVQMSIGTESNACIKEINWARQTAGLGKFGVPGLSDTSKRLPRLSEPLWESVCTEIMKGEEAKNAFNSQKDLKGTYAFAVVKGGVLDCNSIVRKWKEGSKYFEGKMPHEIEEGELFKKDDVLSFLALYNSAPSATADCVLANCTQTLTDNKQHPETKTGSAVICLTTPKVLNEGQNPFSQEQWEKILTSIKNSASAAVPSFLLAATTALVFLASWE